METSVKRPTCGIPNPQLSNYCGQCGKHLRIDIDAILAGLTTEPVLAEVDRRVRAVISTLTNQELVVREATAQVIERVFDIGKTASFLVLIPATLFIAVFGFWGIHSFSDLDSKVKAANDSATAAQKDVDLVDKKAERFNKDMADLDSRINEAEQRAKSAESNVAHLESDVAALQPRYEKAKKILDALDAAFRRRGQPPDREALQKVETAVAIQYTPKRPTILWLDTNGPGANSYERMALNDLPAQILTAQSVAQAENLLATHPEVDAIISNFGGGNHNHPNPGWAFLDYVKTLPGKIPYIFYSTSASSGLSEDYGREARRNGAFGETSNPAELFLLVGQAVQHNSS